MRGPFPSIDALLDPDEASQLASCTFDDALGHLLRDGITRPDQLDR
jgi:hypothetical protein